MRKQTEFQEAIEMAVTKGRGYNLDAIRFPQKDGMSPECLEYIQSLNPKFAPFDCPHMRILLNNMNIMKEKGPPTRYRVGELLCLELARKSVSRRCGVQRGNIVDKEGGLGVLCKAGLYTFELVIPQEES